MKKILVLILCISLMFSLAVPGHAIAGSLIVGGTVVMTLGTAATIYLITAAKTGLDGNIKAASLAQGTTPQSLMESLITTYCNARATRLGEFLSVLNAGVGYMENGSLTFDRDNSDLLTDFFSWAHSDAGGNLIEYDQPADVSFPSYATSGTTVFHQIMSPYELTMYLINQLGCTIDQSQNAWSQFVIMAAQYSGNPCYVKIQKSLAGTGAFEGSAIFIFVLPGINDGDTITLGTQSGYLITLDIRKSAGTTVCIPYKCTGSSIRDTMFTGGRDYNGRLEYSNAEVTYDTNIDTGAFDLGAGYDVNVLDPQDVVIANDIPGNFDVPVGAWLGGVADTIYAGGADLTGTIADGTTDTITLELDETADMQLTQEIAGTVSGDIVDIGSGVVSDNVGDFSLDLRNYFPFCIPFDIYDMLALFSGSASAPVINWRFYIPNVVDQTIVLDFSIFDPVASVLRNMELIAFCVGLAFVSKRLLFGS